MEKFTLTQEHLKLIQRMNIRFEDDTYDGAPAVDIKRPYGNSDVMSDVAEIIGIEKAEDDCGEKYWPKGTRERCEKIHKETAKALQVCLAAQSFEAGEYISDDYRDNWRKL